MKQPRFLWSLLLMGAAGWAAVPLIKPLGAAERPNFLFIITDDQERFTLGAYGDTLVDTPNLDRLAAEGRTFHHAYHMGSWSGAVCLPSRTMIMTGRTVWRIPGAAGPDGALNEFPEDLPDQTLPAVFERAGYETMRTCKIENSYDEANRRFQIRRDATKRGSTDDEGSAWHADQVIDYLGDREKRGAAAPFLIYLGFSHPHDPRSAPEALARKYGADNAGPPDQPNPDAPPIQINWLPNHPFPHGHPRLRDEVAVQGVGERRDPATVRNELGRHYACIENIDTQIGRVLEKLAATGERDRTIIIFTSDHGMSVGRHGHMGKQNLYDHTWRVPLLAKGPGIPAGSKSGAMVYLLDILPTLCELAEIEIPESVEGESFAAALAGRSETARPHVYGVYCGGTKPGIRSISDGRWKLVEHDVLDGTVRRTQLFDLERNPHELLAEHHAPEVIAVTGHRPEPHQADLAGDPAFSRQRDEMKALLAAEMERLGDPYALSRND